MGGARKRILLTGWFGIAIFSSAVAQQPDIPTLPPAIVTPDEPRAPSNAAEAPTEYSDFAEPYPDLPYPDLSEQSLGEGTGAGVGLDSAARGPQSLFDS